LPFQRERIARRSCGSCNEDLKYIEAALAKEPKSILYGWVMQQEMNAEGKPVLHVPPSGIITIVMKGPRNEFRQPLYE